MSSLFQPSKNYNFISFIAHKRDVFNLFFHLGPKKADDSTHVADDRWRAGRVLRRFYGGAIHHASAKRSANQEHRPQKVEACPQRRHASDGSTAKRCLVILTVGENRNDDLI